MAYGRNCGLSKCHSLSSIHPSCPAHCANSPTALPSHTSIFLFKAEAVPTAYLLKWYWPQPVSWQRRQYEQRSECQKQLIVWRKLSSLKFLQYTMRLRVVWGKVLDLDKSKTTEGFVGCWGAWTWSCGLSSHWAELQCGWIWVSFWSHQPVCKQTWSRETWEGWQSRKAEELRWQAQIWEIVRMQKNLQIWSSVRCRWYKQGRHQKFLRFLASVRIKWAGDGVETQGYRAMKSVLDALYSQFWPTSTWKWRHSRGSWAY